MTDATRPATPDPDLWRRAEQAFQELVDLHEADRQRQLEDLRSEDGALHAQVMRLLEADRAADDSFLAPIEGATDLLAGDARAGEADDAPDTPEPYSLSQGQRVGDFVIERPLGRGGMGEVFLASRAPSTDAEGFAQEVALKVMRPALGLIGDELRRRFVRERRILAQLTHPSIATLIDGGSLPDGRPFLAMEFVPGAPITDACRELPLDETLQLFLAACRAVQHAHENLIVHRDLKPSNILVVQPGDAMGDEPSSPRGTDSAPYATVKLLDFGIAGLLEQQDDQTQITQFKAPVTPGYAAPEQLAGGAISTATDVFALGTVLFELLTGERPQEWPPKVAANETSLAEPPRPQLLQGSRRPVPKDLAAITQHALEADPAQRYRSVAELIADLENYRSGLPVAARQGTRWYRLQRFAARHRNTLIAAGLIAAAITAGLVGTWSQAQRAQRQSARAQRVVELLTEVFQANDPVRAQGRSISASDLLRRGSEQIAGGLDDEPLVRAELETVLGGIHRSLGSYDLAAQQLDRSLALLRQADDVELLATALLERAQLSIDTGDTEQARTALEEAIGLRRFARLDSQLRSEIGALLGAVQIELGEREAGVARVEAAHELRLAAALDDEVLARSFGQLADAHYETGDLERAETLYRAGVDRWTELTAPPDPRLAAAQSDLAVVLLRLGRAEEAAPLLREALAARRSVYGDLHVEVADSLRNLSGAERALGNVGLGIEQLEQALAIYRELFGDAHPDTAEAVNNLAVALAQSGDLPAAATAFEQALAAQRALYGERSVQVILPLSSLGNLQSRIGRLVAAERNLIQARELSTELLETGHPHRAVVALNLANLLADTGRPEQAPALLVEARDGFRQALGPTHPNVGVVQFSLGRLLLERAAEPADVEEAAATLQDGARLLAAAPQPFHPRAIEASLGEAEARLRLDDSAGAAASLLAAHALLVELQVPVDDTLVCRLGDRLQNLPGSDLDGIDVAAQHERYADCRPTG